MDRKRVAARTGGILLGLLLLVWAGLAVPQKRESHREQLPARTKVDRTCSFADAEKIVAIGDLHGAYDVFVDILKEVKIVVQDETGIHWAGGRTHLVQMGDIMDRGPDEPGRGARKILDLILDLETEAAAAGGRVHMLIGNHEEMNILGISFGYGGNITVGQFQDFLPAKERAAWGKKIRARAGGNAVREAELWRKLMEEGNAQEVYTRFFVESYGRWIASHNAVVKVNDIVFVHGGISEEFSTYPCDRLNNILSSELRQEIQKTLLPSYREADRPYRILRNSRGPLWYRQLADGDEEAYKDEVDRILKNLGARAMVIGHTPGAGSISLNGLSRFDQKIWVIDTGIWMERGGTKSALVIKHGEFRVWPKDDISDW